MILRNDAKRVLISVSIGRAAILVIIFRDVLLELLLDVVILPVLPVFAMGAEVGLVLAQVLEIGEGLSDDVHLLGSCRLQEHLDVRARLVLLLLRFPFPCGCRVDDVLLVIVLVLDRRVLLIPALIGELLDHLQRLLLGLRVAAHVLLDRSTIDLHFEVIVRVAIFIVIAFVIASPAAYSNYSCAMLRVGEPIPLDNLLGFWFRQYLLFLVFVIVIIHLNLFSLAMLWSVLLLALRSSRPLLAARLASSGSCFVLLSIVRVSSRCTSCNILYIDGILIWILGPKSCHEGLRIRLFGIALTLRRKVEGVVVGAGTLSRLGLVKSLSYWRAAQGEALVALAGVSPLPPGTTLGVLLMLLRSSSLSRNELSLICVL